MALICDTGVLVAAAAVRDPDHDRCATLLADTREPLLVPIPVLVEVDWLLTSRDVAGKMDGYYADIDDGTLPVEDLKREDWRRVRELCAQYADFPLGLVDAAVIAVAERLREPKVATLDHRHFAAVRPRHVAALQLLP